MYSSTKLKVQEITKDHPIHKPLEIRTSKSFKSLSEVWRKEDHRHQQSLRRLSHIFGSEHPVAKQYNEDEHKRRTRDSNREAIQKLLG